MRGEVVTNPPSVVACTFPVVLLLLVVDGEAVVDMIPVVEVAVVTNPMVVLLVVDDDEVVRGEVVTNPPSVVT